MRRIREVLRQRWECGLSERTVATSCSLARSTVAKYVKCVFRANPPGDSD